MKHQGKAGKALLGIAITATLLGVPSPADAAATKVPTNLEARVKTMCARIPNLIIRTDNQLTRLPAGPDTKGSIAWVKARAEQATARGKSDRATLLTNRANVLTQKLATLPNQKAALQQAQQSCVSMGYSS